MNASPEPGERSRRGATLVESVAALVILAVGVLGMVQMGLVAFQQARAGEIRADSWAVAQVELEALRMTPFGSLSAGNDTVGGYPVEWTVAGTEPKTVTLAITRPNVLGGQLVDSVVLVLADWGK